MNESNTKTLVTRYPGLYDKHFIFECGDGWFDLIDNLSRAICGKAVAAQVKQKYGTLRFYCDEETSSVRFDIEDAERESETTCEVCGEPGTLRGSHWLSVSCDDCIRTDAYAR